MLIELSRHSIHQNLALRSEADWTGVDPELVAEFQQHVAGKPDAEVKLLIVSDWVEEVSQEVALETRRRIGHPAAADALVSDRLDRVSAHVVARQFMDSWRKSGRDKKRRDPVTAAEAWAWRGRCVATAVEVAFQLVAGLRLLEAFPEAGPSPCPSDDRPRFKWETWIETGAKLRLLPAPLRAFVRARIDVVAYVAARRCPAEAVNIRQRAGYPVIALLERLIFDARHAYGARAWARMRIVLWRVQEDLDRYHEIEMKFPSLRRRARRIDDPRFDAGDVAGEAALRMLEALDSGQLLGRVPGRPVHIRVGDAVAWERARLLEAAESEVPAGDFDDRALDPRRLARRSAPLDPSTLADLSDRMRGVSDFEGFLRRLPEMSKDPLKDARAYLKKNRLWPALIALTPCALPDAGGAYAAGAELPAGDLGNGLGGIDHQRRWAFVLHVLEGMPAPHVRKKVGLTGVKSGVGVIVHDVGTRLIVFWGQTRGGPVWHRIALGWLRKRR